jgi:hypothetical protein
MNIQEIELQNKLKTEQAGGKMNIYEKTCHILKQQ